MKILLMNQFFWPDSLATSQLLTDLAIDLSAAGHEVHVICASTAADAPADEAPAVTVHRIGSVRFSRGMAGRVASYLSFYAGAAWRALTISRPDVVLTLTTPPLLSLLGALVHRLRGSRFYIWEMDMYPDVAVDLGYIRSGSLLHRVTGALADWSRRQADRIIALGGCMRDRLVARGVDPARVVEVHNWADSSQITYSASNPSAQKLQIVYSGNLGLAHDIDTVLAAILQLRDDSRFSFTFIGGGPRRAELASFVQATGVTSVVMRPYVPRADLGATLGLGDIGLVTQRDDCCGSVVPSKVYGLMAAGRPVLFVGPAQATPARIIRQHACGWHIRTGDADSLVRLLQHLSERPEEVDIAGRNARRALEDYYDRSIGTGQIAALITGSAIFPSEPSSPANVSEETVTSATS